MAKALHNLRVKCNDEMLSGPGTIIELDGQPVKAVKRIEIKAGATEFTEVAITLYVGGLDLEFGDTTLGIETAERDE